MTTLKELLRDPNSPLHNLDVKEAFQPEIFDSLPVEAVESLIELLPLADLTFIRAKPDLKPDDKLEIIIPESIDEALALKQDPWCSPYISPHVFDSPEFRTAWEDFLVLLKDGYYEEDESDEEEEQYKDDAYEEVETQQNKGKGRARLSKKRYPKPRPSIRRHSLKQATSSTQNDTQTNNTV